MAKLSLPPETANPSSSKPYCSFRSESVQNIGVVILTVKDTAIPTSFSRPQNYNQNLENA